VVERQELDGPEIDRDDAAVHRQAKRDASSALRAARWQHADNQKPEPTVRIDKARARGRIRERPRALALVAELRAVIGRLSDPAGTVVAVRDGLGRAEGNAWYRRSEQPGRWVTDQTGDMGDITSPFE
jgi:hypothetical protein